MAWRIPETDIERVKRSTDLRALVQSRGVELKKHGSKDWIGRCPFHADRDKPNFIVTPDKGLFHCMACGKAGNAIQFVQQHDGVSFRHAFELLNQGGAAAFAAQPLQKQTTVPVLSCPLDAAADDATLFSQVAAYYHERLKQSASALAYLESRGLRSDELIARFQIGFADRTLGLRLPFKNRKEGDALRTRLAQLGLWRDSGHEHFNGCIVVPLHNEQGQIVSLYGRPGAERRLEAPVSARPASRPLEPRSVAATDEIILCEAVLDALTFWAGGFRNVTCLFGTEGFTDELWEAVKKVQRVRIAYDADDAGERAAQRDAERFKAHGVEVFRVKFPHGMDANEYAQKVKPADKSLALLLNSAAWLGTGARPPAPPPKPTVEKLAPAPSSLAASVSSLEPDAAKEESACPRRSFPSVSICVHPAGQKPALQQRGDAWFLDVEGREYRVSGLEKTLGTDALKIALRFVPVNAFTWIRWTCAGTWSAAGSSNAQRKKRDSPTTC